MSKEPDPQHLLEQGLALYRDMLAKTPTMLRQFHKDLKDQGFSDSDALNLTKTALIRILGGSG